MWLILLLLPAAALLLPVVVGNVSEWERKAISAALELNEPDRHSDLTGAQSAKIAGTVKRTVFSGTTVTPFRRWGAVEVRFNIQDETGQEFIRRSLWDARGSSAKLIELTTQPVKRGI